MQNRVLGQTLIEVLITLLIIAISVISIVRFQSYLTLALQQIETLKDYQVLTTTSGYFAYQSILTGSSSTVFNGTTYTLNSTVTTYTSPAYKSISVVSSWVDRYASRQSVTLITNISVIDPSNSASVM
jgi:Tfp pilus assembly protein PilV